MAVNFSPFNPDSAGIIRNELDAALNDSDKSFVVPEGKTWEFLWAHIILVSTATVGNRQMNIEVYDDDDVLRFDIQAGAVQAASLTRHYMYLKGIFRETSFVNNELQVPIPHTLYLHPGWKVTFVDATAVAAAADDMTVSFQVMERDV